MADGFVVQINPASPTLERRVGHAHDLVLFACRMNGVLEPEFADASMSDRSATLTVDLAERTLTPFPVEFRPTPMLRLLYDGDGLSEGYGGRLEPLVSRALWSALGQQSEWSVDETTEPVQDWLRRLLGELLAAQHRDELWLRSSERLLGQLEDLLADRDRLLRALAKAYDDLDVAEARIAQLEAARDQLRNERYGVKSWVTPEMIVMIATLVVTCLGVLPSDAIEVTVENQITNTQIVARQVIDDCQP